MLKPAGPCKVLKIQIYLTGSSPAKDTLHIVGNPTAGNLYPTQYVWSYNFLVAPLVINYDGNPGWKVFDVSSSGLRSDGYDWIVIQHRMKPDGPWFGYDSDGRGDALASWMTDPFTPNPNFFDIQGTIYAAPRGDYLLRFDVQYDFPDGETSMPSPPPTLINVSAEAGIQGGGEVSVVDWNNDGWDDIAISGKYYQNNKNGTFTDVTSQLKIPASRTVWGDFNNDGNIDVFVALGWKNDLLMKNNGNGTFSDVTALSTIINDHPTMSPVWVDINNDGMLNLFLANNRSGDWPNEIYHPDQLWLNNGNGSFSNITTQSCIAAGEGTGYDCYGAAAADYNNDGKMDIFVANYRLAKDNLYKNNGNSTFDEVGAATGVQGIPTLDPNYFGHGMGCEWADFNNDGYMDLCVGN